MRTARGACLLLCGTRQLEPQRLRALREVAERRFRGESVRLVEIREGRAPRGEAGWARQGGGGGAAGRARGGGEHFWQGGGKRGGQTSLRKKTARHNRNRPSETRRFPLDRRPDAVISPTSNCRATGK